MNDNTSGTHADDEALEAQRSSDAAEVDADVDPTDDAVNDPLTDELEDSGLGGTERIGSSE